MTGAYRVRCADCRYLAQGTWPSIGELARGHEGEASHHVQVYPMSNIVAPLPRSMWDGASS